MQQAKLYIAEAFLLLLKKKSMDEISIKEIVEKAGVSRMSYYRYFCEKKEILEFYMEYIFSEYMNTLENNTATTFQSYEHILESLLFFQKYKDFALCLHHASMDTLLLETLNIYISSLPSFNASKSAKSYPLYFYAGALYNVYMQWVLEDTKTTPERLATIISKFSKFHSI